MEQLIKEEDIRGERRMLWIRRRLELMNLVSRLVDDDDVVNMNKIVGCKRCREEAFSCNVFTKRLKIK